MFDASVVPVCEVTIKKFLNSIIQEELEPIRNRRKEYEAKIPEVYDILLKGSKRAREVVSETTNRVKEAMGINYFNDKELINEHAKKYNELNN